MKGFKGLMIKIALEILFLLALMLCMIIYASAGEMLKGRATVYSLDGLTKKGTQTSWGVCASGNKNLYGKTVILYQRLPDGTKGDAIGIYRVEDSGCDDDVIDIWCPEKYQQKIIDRTYENGCEGKIYIQIVED